MNADLLSSPTELVAASLTSASDYAPMPAWVASATEDRYVADPGLASKYAHAQRARAEREAARRAAAVAQGYAAPCACCETLVRPADAARTPAGAVLCALCAATQTTSAAPAEAAPSAPVTPAPTPRRAVVAERGAVPVAALPAGVELRRLAAAAGLVCTSLGAGRYRVEGGREPHTVDLTADGAALPPCTCGDAHWRPALVCKHVLAARAARRDPAHGDASIARAVAVLAAFARGAAAPVAIAHRRAA